MIKEDFRGKLLLKGGQNDMGNFAHNNDMSDFGGDLNGMFFQDQVWSFSSRSCKKSCSREVS